jgi:UDP-GlcNAc:undecaprenyl-phosphate GlcNAc-1-phosphate transferase
MLSILVAVVMAALITAGITPAIRKFALRVGAVDGPAARRVQGHSIPRLGGVALVLGFFVPLLILFALHTSVADMLFAHPGLIAGLVAGAILMSGLGALDDLIGLRPTHKLGIQTGAALLAYAAGFRIDVIFLPIAGTIQLGWFAPMLTVFWIVGIINALNLIDGLDGLAGGVAFFACLTNFFVAYMNGNWLICLLSATLAGSIVGFLFYNFNPATIFMGDSGSMFLGFVLATVSIFGAGSQKGSTAISILVPILALGVPIMDTLFAMMRRFLERRPLFSPDRGHIHHRLIDLGLTHRRAVLILYGASIVFTCGALALHVGRSWQSGITLVVLMITVVGAVRMAGALNSLVPKRVDSGPVREPEVERLRSILPGALVSLDALKGTNELSTVLGRIGADAGLLAVELAPGSSEPWRWEASVVSGRERREAVTATYRFAPEAGGPSQLKFQWDSMKGDVNPSMEILLQLVVDAVERAFRRAQQTGTDHENLRPLSHEQLRSVS